MNLTAAQIDEYKRQIDVMTHEQMAYHHRFDASGSVFFNYESPLSSYFSARFKAMGGMTPEISKRIGWTRWKG